MKAPARLRPRAEVSGRPEAGERAASGRAPWIYALKVVAITRLVFGLIAYVAAWLLSVSSFGPLDSSFLELFNRWDAVHFIEVARFGYTSPLTDPHATAFFPLYPLAIRALAAAGMTEVLAGMIVSTAATIVATAYLYKLAELDVGSGAGRRASLYLVLFPTAVFLVAPYSEALFLAGAISAFYYARAGRWLPAAPGAAVAMGARAAGLFLLFGLLWEFVRQRDFSRSRIREAALCALAGLAPLLAYGAYLARVKGNALYFFIDQMDGWFRKFTDPVTSFREIWELFEGPGNQTNWNFAWRLEIVAAAVGVFAVAWALQRREWGYAAYMGSFMAALLTSTWYYSVPRMLLSFFPLMIFLASFTRRHQERHETVLVGSALLACLGVVVFTRGAWFY